MIQTLKKTAIFVGVILGCVPVSTQLHAVHYTNNAQKSKRVYKQSPQKQHRSYYNPRYHRAGTTVSVGPENWQAWDGSDYDPYWNPVTYGEPVVPYWDDYYYRPSKAEVIADSVGSIVGNLIYAAGSSRKNRDRW